MSQISACVRLRPIRYAFLVRPSDQKRILEILRINTCLWGGMYNPIIPYFRQVPAWWHRSGIRLDSAKQIINGYLDSYEPDFLVEAEKGFANGLDFDPKRILKLSELLVPDGDRTGNSRGLDTFDIYKELYKTEFQFERRHNHNIVSITAEDPSYDAFSACVFGDFPKQKNLGYFGRAFAMAFNPIDIALNGVELLKLYQSGYTSALNLGNAKIKIDHNHFALQEPTLFVMNAKESRDLIDFWNLRIMQREVIALPFQWLNELSNYPRNLIKKAYRPLSNNPHGIMRSATIMFSRSIPDVEINNIHKNYFVIDVPGANLLTDCYPSIWRSSSKNQNGFSRPKLTVVEKNFDIHFSEGKSGIQFDSIYPEFSARFDMGGRFANVIKIRDWSHENFITTVLPTDYRNPKFSPFSFNDRPFIPTTEGFVIFPKYRDIQNYWTLPEGMIAISKWFNTFEIKVKLTDAGRATQQIIQRLGGFLGVGSISNAGIVKLLNNISRKSITKSMIQHEFINRVSAEVKDDIWHKTAAEELVRRNAVELGLELKCSKCSSWSWYSLKNIDYKVNCSLCLQEFGFPIIDPTGSDSSRWAYRLIGPFALPDYARGGYSAALAISRP